MPPRTHNMVAAISSFGAGSGDLSGNFEATRSNDCRSMIAAHSA
jgi:hypothetical protein